MGAKDPGGQGRPERPDRRGERGREAERLASGFLEARGLTVLARNHRSRGGEVDLVCQEREELVFVEVRSRSSTDRGGPEETVGVRKARRVVSAATDWALRNGGLDRPIRFDVVAITFGEGEPALEHFPAAFTADGQRSIW
ncbi:MAG: YraN family protein [Anaeromyxobacter sp.]